MSDSTVLVVANFELDAIAITDALRGAGLPRTVVELELTAAVHAYLEHRPELVVADLFATPGQAPALGRLLAPLGWGNVAVPFLRITDGPPPSTEPELELLARDAIEAELGRRAVALLERRRSGLAARARRPTRTTPGEPRQAHPAAQGPRVTAPLGRS